MSLTIIANVKVKPKAIEAVKSQMMALVHLSIEEEGCIKYNLHQDHKAENHFMFYEIWETKALWKQHLKREHVTNFVEDTRDSILNVEVYQMNTL